MEAQELAPRGTPHEKLLALEEEIKDRVFEREEEVRGFLVGLLARAHVLLLGPKGAAKSLLARLLCDAVVWDGVAEGADPYFRAQLGRDSVLDELFGPVSARGYREDNFRRNTSGMLPEAKVALLEEIYNSNPTVLNRLLTLMNEGLFKNGTDPERRVPLRLLVASSNELPDERDDSLEAFHDRFLLRYEVSYLKDPQNVRRMLERANRTENLLAPIAATISEPELLAAAREAAAVDASGVLDAIEALLAELASREIVPSDRRAAGLVSLVKAQAYLDGRREARRADLEILAHALWEDPEEIADVRRIVFKAAHPRAARAHEIFDEVTDSYREAIAAAAESSREGTEEAARRASSLGLDANAALRNAQRKLFELREDAKDSGASDSAGRIDAMLAEVARMNAEVTDRCLGI
jgi:MoxR-like ATPase